MSTQAAPSQGIQAAVLALSPAHRREIATAILWSLPRDEVIALHGQLSLMMQKDIIGLLPPEIAVRILGYLLPDELLQCKLVSRDWARLCDDQAIWHDLCRSHDPPIVASHTTWHDLTVHRQLLHLGSRPKASVDESLEYASDDSDDDGTGFPTPFMPSFPATGSSSPNPFGTPRGYNGAFGRGTVWEHPQGGLPTFQRASAVPSPGPLSTLPETTTTEPPISSHIQLPSALPKVNYKQLYLVRRILNRRMTDSRPADLEARRVGRRSGTWNPRVTILTSQSSTAAGGLPGHVESIYSLHLFQHHMRFHMTTPDPNEQVYTVQRTSGTDVFGTTVSSSWHGSTARSPPPKSSTPVVSGRHWLLTGSKDCTLRLWQMGCLNPRVVKVFSGGHTRSILCHFVIEVPVQEGKLTSSPGSSRRRQRSQSPSKTPGTPQLNETGPKQRLIAVSGGSDGRICVWDIEHGDGRPERVIEAHSDSVLFLRGDDKHIVSCSKDRTIRLFDIHTMEELLVIQQPADSGHRGAINAVGLTRDFIVSASGDRSLRVWDVRDGRMLATIDAHVRGISCMSFEPVSTAQAGWTSDIPGSELRGTVVTGSSDMSIKTFHIVQVPQGTELLNELSFRDMLDLEDDLALDSEEEVSAGASGRAPRPRLIIQPGVEYVATCSCPLPAARQSPRQSGPSGCMHNRGHTDLVRSLFIGEQVTLSASYDSTIKIWNRRTGRQIFDFAGCHDVDGDPGRVFAITGDEVRVVSAGANAHIAIVDFSDGLDTSFV